MYKGKGCGKGGCGTGKPHPTVKSNTHSMGHISTGGHYTISPPKSKLGSGGKQCTKAGTTDVTAMQKH